ncbi:MAG: hypothetical protein Q9219_004291, partial [cf. Caloplaca sp. 3 TL-2023]
MSGLEVAAGVITLISASRKVADGISRLSSLRHAPDVLLALNNEVSDLQCVIEDLSNLEYQYKEILHEAFPSSLHQSIEKTKKVLLGLEALLAYDLTVFDQHTGQLRLDRSAWLRAQKNITRAQSDVRTCRIELSTAMGLLTALNSLRSYDQNRHFGVVLDTFISENSHFFQDVSSRMVGMKSTLDHLSDYVARSQGANVRVLPSAETVSARTADFNLDTEDNDNQVPSFPAIRLQAVKRRYAGFLTLLRKCDQWAVHCHKPRASTFLIDSRADLTAEDSFGLIPRHCLLFHHSEVAQQKNPGLVPPQYDSLDPVSVDDLLESPPIHVCYRADGNSDTFQIMLKSMTKSDLNTPDFIGETLLFKAIRCGDLALGGCHFFSCNANHTDPPAPVQQLLEHGACVRQRNTHGYTSVAVASSVGDVPTVRCLLSHGADPSVGNAWNPNSTAACYATMGILHRVRWVTKDIQKLLNGVDKDVWTPRRMIETRRLDHLVLTNGICQKGDLKQIYKGFMALIQKVIDDHYEPANYHLGAIFHGPQQKRMIPVSRPGSWLWDLQERESVEELGPHVDSDLEVNIRGTDLGNIFNATPMPQPTRGTAASFLENLSEGQTKVPPARRDEFEW